ncbi:conserved hypothetical protein [Bacteroides sp. 3_1_23]|nr:conserved hypothetical protein [Bacteroides sp. 3_1_23]
MKTMKLYLTCCLLAIVTSVSAQFANSSNNVSASSSSGRNIDTNGWNRLSVSVNPMKITTDIKGGDDFNMTGFSLGYTKGFSIAKQIPLFLEVGINARYAFKKLDKDDMDALEDMDGYEMERKYSLLSLDVPLNIAYKFSFPNSNIALVPYIGINFKGNIIGKSKLNLADPDELGEDYDDEDDFWKDQEKQEKDGIRQSTNMFDKKETGDKDATWKRFQMGWQLGIGLYYNQLYAGIGYGKDFTELCKKTKIGTTSIIIGYSF